MRFVVLNLRAFVEGAVLREMLDPEACVTAEDVCETTGPFPGAFRFLDGGGGAALASG